MSCKSYFKYGVIYSEIVRLWKRLEMTIYQVSKIDRVPNPTSRVTSVYEWEGKIETESEVSLILKTREEKKDELTKFVVENHPYV